MVAVAALYAFMQANLTGCASYLHLVCFACPFCLNTLPAKIKLPKRIGRPIHEKMPEGVLELLSEEEHARPPHAQEHAPLGTDSVSPGAVHVLQLAAVSQLSFCGASTKLIWAVHGLWAEG
jgi:hypothetical protein